LNTSRTHNTHWQYKYRNTIIKEEGNRIHLGITKLKVQNYNPILFHTLKNDPKLFDYPPKANLAEREDKIVAFFSQVNLMTNVSKWVVDMGLPDTFL